MCFSEFMSSDNQSSANEDSSSHPSKTRASAGLSRRQILANLDLQSSQVVKPLETFIKHSCKGSQLSKILVVEDTADTREILHLYLTREGFDVTIAVDGSEGLHRALADRPDLIITDITMPQMDGVQMIKQIRREPECALIPIIAMTAYGKGFCEDALEAGATDTIQKPFEFGPFIAQVKSLLKRS
jgi:CheY-like chemotaxis protein